MPPKPPSAEKDLVEGFLEWGTGYALNNLARAQDNDGFASVVEQLQVGCGGVGCVAVVGRAKGGVAALCFVWRQLVASARVLFFVHPAASCFNSFVLIF